jgi:predicted transposase YbfD/YdcC
MIVLEELKSAYAGLEDPRIDRNKKHSLISIIFIVLCSALAGIDDWVGMEDYCEANIDFFSKHFDLSGGVPSHDTIGRVMSRIDISSFRECFVTFTKLLVEHMDGVVAIDGKTARGSSDLQDSKKALHVVSAWSSANNLVLGQIAADEKSNEITAIPKLLEMLDLRGQVVTIDAMGCQRDIAEQILAKGGDYILALKGNQGNLHKDIKFLFDSFEASNWKDFIGNSVETHDKGHGRIETRRVWATEDLGALLEDHKWPGLRSVIMVESRRETKNNRSLEKRLYLTSLKADAEKIGRSIRSHWDVENKLHWVLDVTFNEDNSQISKDNAPENMNLVRKWALNLINKTRGKLSVRRMQNRMKMTGYKLTEILNKKI